MDEKRIFISLILTGDDALRFEAAKTAKHLRSNSEFVRSVLLAAVEQITRETAKAETAG
jgi:hypothetical protein